jgi:hopene-associated glycosyltransferase HpnB
MDHPSGWSIVVLSEGLPMLTLSIVCTAAAVAWAYLIIGHGGFWRAGEWLPRAVGQPEAWPEVVAVVPARNEAEMLPVTLPTLLGQAYPGGFSVILVDDGSSDGTREIAAKLSEEPSTRPLRVIAGKPRERWAGKVWAMAQGLAAANAVIPGTTSPGAASPDAMRSGAASPDATSPGAASPGTVRSGATRSDAPSLGAASPGATRSGAASPGADYVLFTDADIAWQPGGVRELVAAAEGDDRDLVSQMALLRAVSRWERVVVPAFVYFFAQLYPFRRVNAPGSRTAAAAGGCMLVRRDALDRSGGLAPIRDALIDDVALGRMIKRQGGRCWLGLSRQVVSVRPYPGLASLWQMVARSAYTQLNYSPPLLAGTILGLLFLYLLPPAGAVIGLAAGAGTPAAALTAGAGLAGWALMSLSYLPMLRVYRLSPLRAPTLPLIALLYAAMTFDSARRHHAGSGAVWRGRTTATR